jgi:uncharacterized SAM-binding protein YcdF (DUF218 family)
MDDLFFFFSKVLTLFLYPFTIVIIISIINSFFIKGMKNKILMLSPIFLLSFFSTFPVSQFLIRSLELDYPPLDKNKLEKYDAIVVLGGAINILSYYRDIVEMGSSSERMTEAILLFNQNVSDTIIFTGGSGILFQQDISEAYYAKKFFIDFGIPENKLLFENKSKNTFENALYTKEILNKMGKNNILLVTSAFHMRRSYGVFVKQGFSVNPYPTDYKSLIDTFNWDTLIPSPSYLEISTIALKEWVGIIVYKYKGYL